MLQTLLLLIRSVKSKLHLVFPSVFTVIKFGTLGTKKGF